MKHIVECVPLAQWIKTDNSFQIPFTEETKDASSYEVVQAKESPIYIHSDWGYQFILPEYCVKESYRVKFSVNGKKEKECTFDKSRLCLSVPKGKRIFQDCFGFVQLGFTITYPHGKSPNGTSTLSLQSQLIPVMVKENPLNDSVRAMAKYLLENHHRLMEKGKQKPNRFTGKEEEKQEALEAQIHLLEEIWKCYEDCFDYFRTNCRFKIEEKNRVDSLEKLQVVTSETIQFIATHPEYLKKANSTTGISYGNQMYHPEKTLIAEQYRCKNTHENQVILFFLKTILMTLEASLKSLEELESAMEQGTPKEINGYISSYSVMVGFAVKTLGQNKKKYGALREQFQSMFHSYSNILEFATRDIRPLSGMPAPSAILLSVPQYNRIYVLVNKWFHFNKYDFEAEKYLLSMVKIYDMYESYLLAKHIRFFLSEGWEVENQYFFDYEAKKERKYSRPFCDNTFVFSKGNDKITMYHGASINSDYRKPENNLNLYKCTSVRVSESTCLKKENTDKFSDYYEPDFVFKIEKNREVRYIIGDAKFSEKSTVLEYSVSKLVYKYLFSIEPIVENETVSGLLVLYGKDTSISGSDSVYDNESPNKKIKPFAQLVSINENYTDHSHFPLIKEYIEK